MRSRVKGKFHVDRSPQVIQEAEFLPVNERATVVDSLLRSLNQPEPDVDQAWIGESDKRLNKLRFGAVNGISLDAVMNRLNQRFPN
jgi:putative addiction module component (TIGR02574 family)